jgi:hypothetical protein
MATANMRKAQILHDQATLSLFTMPNEDSLSRGRDGEPKMPHRRDEGGDSEGRGGGEEIGRQSSCGGSYSNSKSSTSTPAAEH